MVRNLVNNNVICWGLLNIYRSTSNTKGGNVYKPLRKTISLDSQKCNLLQHYFLGASLSSSYSKLKFYPVTEHKILC